MQGQAKGYTYRFVLAVWLYHLWNNPLSLLLNRPWHEEEQNSRYQT